MAHAARSAHRSTIPPAAARGAVASLLAIGLAMAPCRVLAHTAGTSWAPGDGAMPSAAAEVDEPSADTTAEEPRDEGPDEAVPSDEADPEADPESDEVDEETDDGLAESPPPPGETLRPLQTAAWWTMFGAFAVGTTAGVLAGLAERQEDRATRLSSLFDASTGAQPLYADRQDEYEGYLRRGDAYAKAAIGVAVIAGVATIASITLFAIDAKRQRSDRAPRTALRVRPGGLEVRF
ncbi:MAG: hypothetical protein AB1Z98_10115 [Nannocystaceae bacterium]